MQGQVSLNKKNNAIGINKYILLKRNIVLMLTPFGCSTSRSTNITSYIGLFLLLFCYYVCYTYSIRTVLLINYAMVLGMEIAAVLTSVQLSLIGTIVKQYLWKMINKMVKLINN